MNAWLVNAKFNEFSNRRLHFSLGYCEKVEVRGHKPIGQYGNGFKSGSMRLGRDAMVFTKSSGTFSVGFLSQTYLEKIKSDTVLVPIVTWNATTSILSVLTSWGLLPLYYNNNKYIYIAP